MRRATAVAALLLISVGLFTVGAWATDEIVVQLKWYHSAQFAGAYAAVENGLFADEDISAELVEGTKELDEVEVLLAGDVEFAIVTGAEVLRRRSSGEEIVAIAVIYQISPSVYFSLTGSGITRPEDLAGRRVLVYWGDEILPALLGRVGLTLDDVIAVSPGISLDALYSGEVDVWSGYLTGEVLEARAAGYELNVIFPSDYGIHMYADTVITTQAMVDERPDLVERFLRALLAGWTWAVQHPEDAAAHGLLYDENLDLELQTDQQLASIPLIVTGQGEIGGMAEETWQGMHDLLVERGLMEPMDDIGEAYTTVFLDRIHGAE
jgi:NitT/TauT family transport system substrate-binding protein